MPIILDNPVPITPTVCRITSFTCDFVKYHMVVQGETVFSNGEIKGFSFALQDEDEVKEFSDFYRDWTTTEQLYDKLKEKLTLVGNYQQNNDLP